MNKTMKEKTVAKKSKVGAKKAKAADKKAKVAAKRGTAAKACVTVLLCGTLAAMLTGCLSPLERADPASKSARSTYGAITVTATEGSTVHFTLGDGAFTAADGDGDTTATATNSAKGDARLAVPLTGWGALIQAGAGLISQGLSLLGSSDQTTPAAPATSATPAASLDCPDGNCSEAVCPDGNCSEAVCPDGNCSL